MNKFQRRLYSYPRKDIKSKENEVEEVFPPKSHRNVFKSEKPMTNRSCGVAPYLTDATEQCTEVADEDQYQNLLIEQYGFDPRNLNTIDQLKEIKKLICGDSPKIDNASQCNSPIAENIPSIVEAECNSKWQDIDNTEDIDKFMFAKREDLSEQYLCDEIEINEIPKVKVIAEKFMKFKRDDIEVRKLEEKVVCVEYDVYKRRSIAIPPQPIQKLRTYFSVRPVDARVTRIPSSVKLKYNIASEDLKKLNDKEIEVIDGKISENKLYLDDLRRVLKRKRGRYERRNKPVLDLMSLYKMAKRNADDDMLSKAELEEIKDLITKNCATSVHGISRRTFKSENESNKQKTVNDVSESIFTELLRSAGGRNTRT